MVGCPESIMNGLDLEYVCIDWCCNFYWYANTIVQSTRRVYVLSDMSIRGSTMHYGVRLIFCQCGLVCVSCDCMFYSGSSSGVFV
jgi:hypothetical protein